MYRISISLIALIVLTSKSSQGGNQYPDSGTKIYKLLYMNDYGLLINEKSFWASVEDGYDSAVHKSNFINYSNLSKYLETLHKDEPYEGFIYDFAFIFDEKDTIYASKDLKSWILKKNGKEIFYSGSSQNKDPMDLSYKDFFFDPFFNPCW